MGISDSINKILPKPARDFIQKQFDASQANEKNAETGVSFDKLRASVNLVVAAILISFATSLTLPLSTTYVTFMVAMGTSLADRAWGRESAVYRITGVISVIGGWFLTALSAFTVAFILVNIINWGEVYAIIVLLAIAITMIIRTHKLHKTKREFKEKQKSAIDKVYDNDSAIKECSNRTQGVVNIINENFKIVINALFTEDHKKIKEARKSIKKLNKTLKDDQANLDTTIAKLKEEGAETSHYYVQVSNYLREIGHCLNYIVEPSYEHINNMHKGLIPIQKQELDDIRNHLSQMLNLSDEIIEHNAFTRIDELIQIQKKLLSLIKDARKEQIRRIKHRFTGKKNAMLYFNILQETKNLTLYSVNLIKAHRDFITHNDSDFDLTV
jgi:Na+/phosphate symporter